MSLSNDIAIDVRDLVKVYEKRNAVPVRALNGISFRVRRGEIFGLLGPNGAGKTTTLKILTTLLQPTGGSATLLGYDVVREPLAVRKSICVVVQENAVELYLSVQNNFLAFGRFHGLSGKETAMRTDRVVDLFGLREYLGQKAIDLSGGVKRRLQVAKMFLVDKPVVFLDEATTGMDTFNKRTTLNAIKEESNRGRTIVLTTHMLDEAEELCSSVAIVNRGSIVTSGSMQKVKSMGLQLYYLSLTFRKMTPRILRTLRLSKPLKLESKDHSVTLTVRNESAAFSILSAIRRTRALSNFEITSASLEDVFVELIDKRSGAA